MLLSLIKCLSIGSVMVCDRHIYSAKFCRLSQCLSCFHANTHLRFFLTFYSKRLVHLISHLLLLLLILVLNTNSTLLLFIFLFLVSVLE